MTTFSRPELRLPRSLYMVVARYFLPPFRLAGVPLAAAAACPPCVAAAARARSWARLRPRLATLSFFTHRSGSGAGRSLSGMAAIDGGSLVGRFLRRAAVFDSLDGPDPTSALAAVGRRTGCGRTATSGVDSSVATSTASSASRDGIEARKSRWDEHAAMFVSRSACSGESCGDQREPAVVRRTRSTIASSASYASRLAAYSSSR